MKHYLAIDLGATSGRTIVGTLDKGRIDLEELTRFDNPLIALGGHLYWDLYALYNEIIRGLQLTAQRGIDIQSIGIDTWGCDFAFFGDDGALLGNPIAYRDPHTNGMMEHFFNDRMPKDEVYRRWHTIYELQQPLPALCHGAARQQCLKGCQEDSLHS